jgi:hypothetical protein
VEVAVSKFNAEQTRCDLCRSEFHIATFEHTAPNLLTEQRSDLRVCPACRVVYNFDPADDGCLDCGTTIESSAEGFRFELEFPVNDEPDAPIARLSGGVCGDCAAHSGLDTLFNGINARDDAREQLLRALDCTTSSPTQSAAQSESKHRTEESVR